MNAERFDWVSFFWGAVWWGAWAAAMYLAAFLWLGGCNTAPAAAAGPTGPEKAVTGEWAAALPAGGLVHMSLAASGSYQVTIEPGGYLAERERGSWLLRASRVVFSPKTCERAIGAGDLALVSCTGLDSIPAAAEGDRWPVTMAAGGQLVTLEFHRL